ncbi:hypothetical protein GCM10008967_35810 [Bacillus carboniphilus]|uniref:Uncharacterized protein n=1 Tax=Bacillus carboniphilus TaxID=86663 RepID=A0ABP3GCP7_9BACI
MSKSRNVFLTTAGFHVPDVNQNGDENNRIVITLTNPTNRTLKAHVRVESYSEGEPSFIFLPAEYTLTRTILEDFGKVEVQPNTITRLEAELPALDRSTLRVVTKGDYKTEDGNPASGKLEISSVVGYGNTLAVNLINIPESLAPGLHSADTSTLFRYEDYIVTDE